MEEYVPFHKPPFWVLTFGSVSRALELKYIRACSLALYPCQMTTKKAASIPMIPIGRAR